MGIFNSTPSTAANPDQDRERFEQLCSVVSLGMAQFKKTGAALREIRDRELHKAAGLTWADCCKLKWGISVRHADRLIDAAEFCDEVGPTGPIPQNERQVRKLRTLPKEQQLDAWHEAAAAGGTPAAIDMAIKKRKPGRPRKPKPIRLRVPGAWVTIEPNKKFTGPRESLQWALELLAKREAA